MENLTTYQKFERWVKRHPVVFGCMTWKVAVYRDGIRCEMFLEEMEKRR